MDYKELIENLNGYFEGKELKRGDALKAATAIETLLEERKAEEWVSVKDRLPSDEESGDEFICMTSATGRCRGVIALRYEVATVRGELVRRWKWLGRNCLWEVTHWKPLPEPTDRFDERGDIR